MNRLVDLIEKNKEELATLETLNNGKPRFQSAGTQPLLVSFHPFDQLFFIGKSLCTSYL
jgi:acyl-CoA reductase-like NAD-dependent aldehyde dehydrogenase